MFGSVSAILDTDEDSQYGDAHKVIIELISGVFLETNAVSDDAVLVSVKCTCELAVCRTILTEVCSHPTFSQNQLC